MLQILDSDSEDSYTQALKEADEWAGDDDRRQDFVLYLHQQWFDRHAPQCVKFWTNEIMHFGLRTTSPGETANAGIKAWLQSASKNLLTFIESLLTFFDHHVDRHYDVPSKAQNNAISAFTNDRFYDKTVRKINNKGQELIRAQRDKAKWILEQERTNRDFTRPPCTGVFRKTTGSACSH